MISVASRGRTDRIAARSFVNTLQLGSGTRAKYSSTVAGVVRRVAAPRRATVRFIGRILNRYMVLGYRAEPRSAMASGLRCLLPFRVSTQPLTLRLFRRIVLCRQPFERIRAIARSGSRRVS